MEGFLKKKIPQGMPYHKKAPAMRYIFIVAILGEERTQIIYSVLSVCALSCGGDTNCDCFDLTNVT